MAATKPDLRVPPPRPSDERIAALNALADWRREWAQAKLADAPFEPAGRKKGSDYNQHYVDLEADDDAFHERARQIMGLVPAPVAAKFNPAQLRDEGGEDGGQWIRNPAAAIKDVLKLAGRIDLDDDEHLLGSGKVDGDFGGARFALAERGGQHRLRLGLGGEGFGQRDRDSGTPAWNGNNDIARINAERKVLRDEYDRLGEEYDNATPARQAEIAKRMDELDDMETQEVFTGGATAILDPAGSAELHAKVSPAVEAADRLFKENEAYWDRIDAKKAALTAERVGLIAVLNDMDENLPAGWTDAQKAEYQTKLRRVRELHGLIEDVDSDAMPGSPFSSAGLPGSDWGDASFASGVIPGADWGDVHYEVYIDDPSLGAQLTMGVKPRDAAPDWELTSEDSANFEIAEARKFLRLLAQMTAAPKP